jgi:predicted  nucleic acid-binding Zn-ribbon protein
MTEGKKGGGSGSGDKSQRGIPDNLREAIEGAFAATEKTRQELTEKTMGRAHELADEMSRRGDEARGTLEGMRLVSRDELRALEQAVDELSSRVASLEAKSKPQVDS